MPTKPETRADAPALVDVRDLSVHFELRGGTLARLFGRDTGTIKAVDGVDLRLRPGEVVGLVGESGSGKSTLGRALLGLVPATSGSIHLRDQNLAEMSRRQLRAIRRVVQMVFQDPNAALNPSMTIEEAVGDALRVHGMKSATERRAGVVQALERVGLSPVELFLNKYPRDLSGGQKQRVVLARAIVLNPTLLVADEPVSMLDMSVRAKILQLMLDLKHDLELTYVYITHDLATAKYFCDRVAIMYLGRIVEIGPTEEIFAQPRHPYTKALLAAIPEPDPDKMVPRDLPRGEIPDAAQPPLGCAFHPRCPEAVSGCGWESRDLRTLVEEHWLRADAAYDEERRVIGDLDHLDTPSTTATLGVGGSAQVRAILDRMRTEDVDEPLWSGVTAVEDSGSGVTVHFEPAPPPPLRRAGGVEVACVLYPDEGRPDA
ncbi:MAG TPA: ABC transporter ATP-binding protein [Nocardioides sp.]|uniref:ABC transporter ATP-binding protein n=1 Tax=Nocardioides sp. TaxID=35761 RepID=UPI002F3EC367